MRSTSRVVDLEVILMPGVYLAGMYPCLEWISKKRQKISTVVKEEVRINLEHLVFHLKRSYGLTINVLKEVMEEPKKILDRLLAGVDKGKVPKRLILPLQEIAVETG